LQGIYDKGIPVIIETDIQPHAIYNRFESLIYRAFSQVCAVLVCEYKVHIVVFFLPQGKLSLRLCGFTRHSTSMTAGETVSALTPVSPIFRLTSFHSPLEVFFADRLPVSLEMARSSRSVKEK